ncbi:MAG: hypothetical protein NTV49_14490 [Kiritimatiellaeota bacterium]|nr:hypothetical protein [Kiritimatiellota bacterium]
MNKKTHSIIVAVALAVALPLPPIKGGIPAAMWMFSSLYCLFDRRPVAGTAVMLLLAAICVGVVVGIAAALTWLSWKLHPKVMLFVTLAILLAGLAYLMTRPIYDGGGWLDPVPSKTFFQMMKTGI